MNAPETPVSSQLDGMVNLFVERLPEHLFDQRISLLPTCQSSHSTDLPLGFLNRAGNFLGHEGRCKGPVDLQTPHLLQNQDLDRGF